MGNLSDRYSKSLDWLDHARLWTPTGAQTISKAPERFTVGSFPVYVDRGDGAYCWDVDGNTYLDMVCGLACMTLGYRHPQVDKAIRLQMEKGISFSLSTKLEADVAERLCAVFPCGHNGSVRFVKTGSEANEGVVRIARRATGRKVIVTVKTGYHSWHAWFSAVKDVHPGVPEEMEGLVRGFLYNDLDSLAAVLDSTVAAVILEPTLNEKPKDGFLNSVKRMAHDAGALLIFDEVVCAGRWARGGGQEYFGVIPDIATAGKSLANGMPLGCIIGQRDLMQHADVVSGTFGGETLSLAACSAVLDIYRREPVVERLWERGKQLQDGFNLIVHQLGLTGIGIGCDGFAVKPRFFMEHHVMSLFLEETAIRGLLIHPSGCNVSAAMTEYDIDFALGALKESLLVIKEAIDKGDVDARRRGKLIQNSSIRPLRSGS